MEEGRKGRREEGRERGRERGREGGRKRGMKCSKSDSLSFLVKSNKSKKKKEYINETCMMRRR